MSWDKNPYYEPESFGLKTVETIDRSRDYEFDLIVVWQELTTKQFYLGTDSGCSCPTPFENYDGLVDMTGPLTAKQVVQEVGSLAPDEDLTSLINALALAK